MDAWRFKLVAESWHRPSQGNWRLGKSPHGDWEARRWGVFVIAGAPSSAIPEYSGGGSHGAWYYLGVVFLFRNVWGTWWGVKKVGAQPMSGIFGCWLLARPLAGTIRLTIWMEYFSSCLSFLTAGQPSCRFSKGRKERLPFYGFPNILLMKKYNTDSL